MTDIDVLPDHNTTPDHAEAAGLVSLSRLLKRGFAPGGKGGRAAGCYVEEYEIEIGRWKATIVKQVDYRAGKTRFSTRLGEDQRKSWRPKRARMFTARGSWRQGAA